MLVYYNGMENKLNRKQRGYKPVTMTLVHIPILGVIAFLLFRNQANIASIISLMVIVIIVAFFSYFILSALRTVIRRTSEIKLHDSLFTIGYMYDPESTVGSHLWPPYGKPWPRPIPKGSLFVRYILNILFLKDQTIEARIISTSFDLIPNLMPYKKYGIRRLNHEVYNSVHLGRKINKKFKLENKEKFPALASYIFVELSNGVPLKKININKVMFLSRNGYSPKLGLQMKDLNMEALEAFEDVPPSWVSQALFGENK